MSIAIRIGGLAVGSSGSSWTPKYYVSNAGNDALDGLTQATAWQSIAKVDATSFVPGDTIGFKKGDIWRETLIAPSSGDVSNPIIFGAYGSGATPVIDGTDLISTWTPDAGNFASGFENETDLFTTEFTSKTATHATITVQATEKHSGSKAAAITWGGAGGTAYFDKTGIADSYWTTFYFKLSANFAMSSAAGVTDLCSIMHGSGTNLHTLQLCADSGQTTKFHLKCRALKPASNYYFTGANDSIQRNVWYKISIHWVESATVGGAELFLDDVSQGSLLNTNTSTYQINWLRFGGAGDTPINTAVIYIDDCKVGNVAGSVNIYDATVALVAPNLVYKNDILQTLGSSRAALNDHEWFFTGGVLSYRDDSDTPALMSATLRNYALTTNAKSNIILKSDFVKYGNYKRFHDNFLEMIGRDLIAEPTLLVSDDGLRLDLWTSYSWYMYSTDGISFSTPVAQTGVNGTSCRHMMKVDNTYYQYASVGQLSIHLYTGTDRIAFTDQGEVLPRGGAGTWDSDKLGNMFVWKEGVNWFMLYEANKAATGWKIGLATSADGLSWTKHGSNPVLNPAYSIGNPELPRVNNEVIKYNNRYYCYYHDFGHGNVSNIRRAYSTDLVTWVEEGVMANRNIEGAPFITFVDQAMVQFKGKSYMFYTPSDQSTTSHIDCGIDNRSLAEMLALTP